MLFSRIRTGTINFKHKEFDNVSDEAKDLITKMLVVDPDKRLTAVSALNHPWFNKKEFDGSCPAGIKLDKDVIKRLCQFKGGNKLKRAAMIMFVKLEDQQKVDSLHE